MKIPLVTDEVMRRLSEMVGATVTVVYLYQGDKEPCRWTGVLRDVVPFERIEIQMGKETVDPVYFLALLGAIRTILAADGTILYENPAVNNGYVFPENEENLREFIKNIFGEVAANRIYLKRLKAREETGEGEKHR